MSNLIGKYSGIQKQILKLYKDFLKEIRKFPETKGKQELFYYIRNQFKEKSKKIPKREFQKIEYLLNFGKRQLKLLKEIDNFSITTFIQSQKEKLK